MPFIVYACKCREMRRDIGVFLIAIGFLLVILSLVQTAMQSSSGQGNIGFGGVILIGPIPIIFGSSPVMAVVSMLMAIALVIISFFLFRRSS